MLEEYLISLVSQIVDRIKREFKDNLLSIVLEDIRVDRLKITVIIEHNEKNLDPPRVRLMRVLSQNPFKFTKVHSDIVVLENIIDDPKEALTFLRCLSGTIVYDKDFLLSEILNEFESGLSEEDVFSMFETASKCLEDAENAINENNLIKAIYKASLAIDISLRALNEIAEYCEDLAEDLYELEYNFLYTSGDLFENPLIRNSLSYRSSVLELLDRAKKTVDMLENLIFGMQKSSG